jgi:hypothetical protein
MGWAMCGISPECRKRLKKHYIIASRKNYGKHASKVKKQQKFPFMLIVSKIAVYGAYGARK